MNGTMTWKAIVTFCTVCAVGLWGCGGGGGGGAVESHRVIPDGYSEVSFTADAATNAAISHTLGSALLDASDLGTGTASGTGGPTSIFDSAAVTCTFTTDSATNTQAYQITNLLANCINENECIVCTVTGAGTDACSLACDGVVPSNAASAADTFDIFVAFTSAIQTDMPDPYGTIRTDVSRTGTSFNLTSASSVDVTGCTYDAGVAHELSLTPIVEGTWFTNTAANHRDAMTVVNVDPDAGNSNRTSCTTIKSFTAAATLTGADTPGTSVSNNLGVVTYKSKICDYEDDSPAPNGTSFFDESVCTEP